MGDQNTNTTGTAPETQQEKTFTQEQVNAIVSKRLAEAKASNEAALSKREAELNQREMQIRAKELLTERGLPKQLADVLKYSDEKSLIAAIDVIEHTRGFKEEEQEKNGKPKRRILVQEPLPLHDGGGFEPDPFRKAMGLK